MNCAACSAANEADSLFCEACGEALERRCSSCGAGSKPRARFCRHCGEAFDAAPAAREERDSTPLAERDRLAYTPRHLADKILGSKAAMEGERKQVTVLFADVKSSMELAEQLDAEEWHGILNRFFEILTEGVHRFEGNVNQYTGDGIMALFGAPIAHEDHAHRACYTALYLRSALTKYTDQLRVERGLNFSVRIGINSGEVVVGKIGDDLRMDYTAQGHTVGLAQRMESLAEPGKALLAGNTIEIVEGFFALRDLGETRVKGVEEPVRIAELEDVGAMRTRLDRSRARGLSKFVGRDEDIQRLEHALERALDGEGQVVGIVAEAGTGKSRLCFEFLERCRTRNIAIRTSTGVPHGHAMPLQPILEFYRDIFGVKRDDDDAQARQKIAGMIAQIAPEELPSLPLLFDFMRVPDPEQPAPQMSPEERQHALMNLIRRLTAARSRREPAVLAIEDLHWLDPQTEEVIDWIVDGAESTRTLFLVNFRPEFRADWMSRSHYQQISLRPLSAEAAGELLAEWLGPDESLTGFAERVRDRTGGNPFFMEEVVQAQIEAGALVGTRGRFQLVRDIDTLDVPTSVQALLAARIDRLDEQTKSLLQTAAVIGDEMAESLLAEVAGLGFDALRDHLRRLVQNEFLYEATLYPELGYAFKHPLTREVAYKSLLSERRRSIHATVAKKLEVQAGESAPSLAPLIAHHWEEAGHKLEAARWQAVACAGLGTANTVQSLYHWGKVIELLEADESPQARTLRGRARAQVVYAASRSARPQQEVAQLFADAQRDLGDTDSRELALALSFYSIARAGAGLIEEGHALGNQAIAMARRLADRGLLAFTLANACITHPPWNHPDSGIELADEVAEICGDDPSTGSEINRFRPAILAGVLRAGALAHVGRGDEIEPLMRQLDALMVDSDDPLENALYRWAAASERLDLGDLAGGLEHSRQSLSWAMRSTNEALRGLGHWVRGTALLRAGRLEEAAEQLNRAKDVAIGQRVNMALATSIFDDLFELERARGDADAARSVCETGLTLVRSAGIVTGEALLLARRAEHEIASGVADLSNALADLERAAELTARIPSQRVIARIVHARALLARSSGDRQGYLRHMRETSRLYRANGAIWLADQIDEPLAAQRD